VGPSRIALVAWFAVCCASPATAYQVQSSDEGLPLRWPAGEVLYHLAPHGGWPVPTAQLETAVDAAFATWAALPELGVDLARGPAAPGGFGHDPAAADANVVRYEASTWEYDSAALMLTFTSYRVTDGAIVDADILINGVNHRWRTDGSGDDDEAFDLQNSLTHEVGHFLGLAHSPDHPEATMFPSTTPAERSKRVLSTDDTDGIDYLYVATELLDTGLGQTAGCSVSGRAGGPGALLGAALALVAATCARRRPRRPHGRRRQVAPLLAALVLLSAPTVGATTLRYLSLETLARTAEVVVQGHVVTVRAHRVGRLIVTDTTLEVTHCLRGTCGGPLVVRQPGGEVDGVGLHVEGTFRARPGEEFVLFLRRGRDGALAPVGMLQGALRVERSRGRPAMAVRDLSGVVVVEGRTAVRASRQSRPLNMVVSLIREQRKEGPR
jgi:hypothetical protein